MAIRARLLATVDGGAVDGTAGLVATGNMASRRLRSDTAVAFVVCLVGP